MERTLRAIAEHLHGRLIGDGATLIQGINSVEAAQEGELTFADDPRHLAQAITSRASAVIVPSGIEDLQGRSGISVENPKLAFALILDLFNPAISETPGVHPSAVLGDNVRLGEGVSVRACAVVGNDVLVGSGTTIESGVHVGDGVTIGEQCLIGPNVVIYRQTHIGSRVRIHAGSVLGGDGFGYVFHQGRHVKVPQVGNVIIEDDVEIGCNVCIDRATLGSTIVKRGTKIDNLVQIAHNDRIGEHVIITGQCGLSGSVTVGNYAVLGGRTGVTDHVTIGDGAQIGICSVVTKSIPPRQVVFGYPARPVREAKRQIALVARLAVFFERVTAAIARLSGVEQRLDALERRERLGRRT